ncbi:MAG: hypothetical protein Q4D41_07100 [Prevotellaceae bacterium]|nr:hypothetical protein [Prevotellaceae bacterium]
MDTLSSELNEFLVRLGKEPDCVSEKVEHYMKHLMHLLPDSDATILKKHYGLFGNDAMIVDEQAKEYGKSSDELLVTIEKSLRKIAVSPEWQMVKSLIDKS